MVTNWFSTYEIDACNDDSIVVIIEIIAGNSLEKKHLISLIDLFRINLNKLDLKSCCKQEMSPLFLPLTDSPERKERGSRRRRREA
jgi:hypothetical protein